jgi:3-hydroxyacyl-[acyl-carrier-protein] dehydratase
MRLEHFQMVDKVLELDPAEGFVRASCAVPAASPIFEGHFPGHPILPGVLMIEAMAQTGGWLVLALRRFAQMPFLAQVRQAKLRDFVEPGQLLTAEVRLLHDGSGYAVATGRLAREARTVAEVDMTYRVVSFPSEALRRAMLDAARRMAVPEDLLNAA